LLFWQAAKKLCVRPNATFAAEAAADFAALTARLEVAPFQIYAMPSFSSLLEVKGRVGAAQEGQDIHD
jgi:hypothetical protein